MNIPLHKQYSGLLLNFVILNYRRKKNKVAATSKCLVVPEDDQHDVNAEDDGSLHHSRVLPKKSVKKDKSTKSVKKDKSSKSVKKDKSSALESNDTTKSATIAKRYLCSLYVLSSS